MGKTAPAPGDVELAVGAARSELTQRLFDSLVHDVRNPLNALSINLDVLTEKLRRELGEIPETQEKNLRVMREQIFRVDGIMKQFSEFLGQRPEDGKPVPVSELLGRALQVLGHECRRSMIRVRQMVEPELWVPGPAQAVRFCLLQPLLRALTRSGQEAEVQVTLQREGDLAALRIRDAGPEGTPEPFPLALPALEQLARSCGAELRAAGPELTVLFPLHR